MLPPERRLTRRSDFSEVVRRGRHASRTLLTLHLAPPPAGSGADAHDQPPARAGLVVSKAVGGSVVRHRVARRLRGLLRDRLPELPAGTRLVVRAAPCAGPADSTALGVDLDAALARLARPGRSPRPAPDRPAPDRPARAAGTGLAR